MRTGVENGAYGTTLLRGVTGSGKTEVYLEAVAACLAAIRLRTPASLATHLLRGISSKRLVIGFCSLWIRRC